MTAIELRATSCAICHTEGNAKEVYPGNFQPDHFSPAVFSARRLPDRIHYRIVRCDTCGLVRSDPAADSRIIAELYGQSTFDYSGEIENLAATYGSYLAGLDRVGAGKGSLLEIGCGNGFFLRQARAQGYRDVHGIEPSQAAIDLADPDIKRRILCGMMSPGLFPQASFDVICLFQVLDHLLDPGGVLQACFDILKPGGFILCLNHNVEALPARLLKDRSPIIDIEHTYLYSRATIARIFSKHGFQVREAGGVRNRYSLSYLTRLLPLPRRVKQAFAKVLDRIGLSRVALSVPLGNLYIVVQKPS